MAGYGKNDPMAAKARKMVGKEFFSEKKPPMGPPMSAKTGPAMYAKGGKAMKHDDAKQDAKMVKKMVKPTALTGAAMAMKKGGKAYLAAGGAAKIRKSVAMPNGAVNKGAVPRGKMRGA